MGKRKSKRSTKKLTDNIQTKNGYYIYRFLNKDNVIVYVGRTTNLAVRFRQHEHLTKDVVKIEYIVCKSYADMIWKEIYYINYFKNPLMTNDKDVFEDNVTELNIKERWIEYDTKYKTSSWIISKPDEQLYEENILWNMYESIVLNFNKNYDYRNLIHILEHEKLNDIGKNKYDLSHGWYIKNYDKLDILRKHISNFYQNIVDYGKVSDIAMWTTYGDFFDKVKGRGYTKSYIYPFDQSFKTEYSNRFLLAYTCNFFFPAVWTINKPTCITEQQYALLNLIIFLKQSALQHGHEIWIYIPSKRMRDLLKEWILYTEIQNEEKRKKSIVHPIEY